MQDGAGDSEELNTAESVPAIVSDKVEDSERPGPPDVHESIPNDASEALSVVPENESNDVEDVIGDSDSTIGAESEVQGAFANAETQRDR